MGSEEVYVSGEFVPRGEAKVSPFDRGFLYGDGLFETVRIVSGVPFRLEQHTARMNGSCKALGWGRALRGAELRKAAAALIERNQVSDGYLRITASRGLYDGNLAGLGVHSPTVVIEARRMELPELEAPPDYALARCPYIVDASWPLVGHKTLSYQGYILALAEGRRRGADEVYFVNSQGHVTEGAIANIFFVRSGTVCTAEDACGLLPGVTRAAVIELCESEGLALRSGRFTPEDLAGADEAFCTNSLRGVVKVSRLPDPPQAEYGEAPVTEALRRVYAALVRAECAGD